MEYITRIGLIRNFIIQSNIYMSLYDPYFA